jgi:hypothetical protein
MLTKLEDKLVGLEWKAANDNVEVKLLAQDKELYVLAKSKDRRAKERANILLLLQSCVRTVVIATSSSKESVR